MLLEGPWVLARDPGNTGREEGWFASGPVSGARPARVPGIIQETFPDYHGVAWYWCRFTAEPDPGPAMEPELYFHGGVDYLGEVWLNGVYLGGHEGGEGPFVLNASSALHPREENLLVVRVLNPTNIPIDGLVLAEVPHANKVVPYRCGASYNYGGILLPVEVRWVPAVRVTDLFVRPNPQTGAIPLTVTLRNDLPGATVCQLSACVTSSLPGVAVPEDTAGTAICLQPGLSTQELVLRVHRPHLWDVHEPSLYRVNVKLGSAEGSPLEHDFSVRCGFRELRIENGFFRLNGRRLLVRSTHTGNHFPCSWPAASHPELWRQDLINAKACGLNMVRFIAHVALPEQLDFCDEIGLMVYEECMASWCLEDSPRMAERFDRNTMAMVMRDRNHPSVTVWGLLNETNDGPVFRHAVGFLPQLRKLDPTRLVLLNSGRWDRQRAIGSISNPYSEQWEHSWGLEAPDAQPAPDAWPYGGYREHAGDAHFYPRMPQTNQVKQLLCTLGHDSKPVFLSEYGVGSLLNVLREIRRLEEKGLCPELPDTKWMRSMAEQLERDWRRWQFEEAYPFAEAMLRDSQRHHVRQRVHGLDLIRANGRICGCNLTGMLDHALTGEGLWTFTREWKPGITDALSDALAPVHWCLSVDPLHAYSGCKLNVRAALANEDVLKAGSYPVSFRIWGPQGVAWEKEAELIIPEPAIGEESPLVLPILEEKVEIPGPGGTYALAAYMEQGAAPTGGEFRFYVTAEAGFPRIEHPVTIWGIQQETASWLSVHGLRPSPFEIDAPKSMDECRVILVGEPSIEEKDSHHWTELARRIANGSVALFLSPAAFSQQGDPLGWLPLVSKSKSKSRLLLVNDWLYHKECVAKRHPVFAGLQAPGIMDWDYYGPLLSSTLFESDEDPADVIVAAFMTGHPEGDRGYGSGLMMASYRFGAGSVLVNTLRILENVGRHPAADRLLINLINYAGEGAFPERATLPERRAE